MVCPPFHVGALVGFGTEGNGPWPALLGEFCDRLKWNALRHEKAVEELQEAQAETQKIKAELEEAQAELASFRTTTQAEKSLHLATIAFMTEMTTELGEEKDKANAELQKANAEVQKANAEVQKTNAELERARKKSKVEGRSSQERFEALFGGEAELQVHSFPHNALLKAQAETQTAQAETQKIKAKLEVAQDKLASFRHLQSLHLFMKEEREKMIKELGEEKDKANAELQKANAEVQKANAEVQKTNAELERARKKSKIQRAMNLLA